MDKIDRRDFLRKAGVGAVGLAAATGPWVRTGQAAKNSPNDTVNVAVMGIHSRGAQHAEDYARIPGVRVSVLCDIDQRLFPEAVAAIEKIQGVKPRTETDIRKVVTAKDVDVVSIASTNHWHSLAGIWACQNGKDVYVEKPVSHNIWEGRKLVEAARKYDRIAQTGSQNRSLPLVRSAMDFIHEGKLGKIYMVKANIFRPRESIGRGKITPVPQGVDYDLWLGPAQWKPFNEVQFHYNWHWFWDTGSGETGNNGPHYTDMARWALQKYELPQKIQSMGGFFQFDSEQETPNTQLSVMQYRDGTIFQVEVRGLYTNSEADGQTMGLLFYGTEGWMRLGGGSWETFYGRKNEPGEKLTDSEAENRYDTLNARGTGGGPHFNNFIDAVRAHDRKLLNAEILEGHLSASMCHLANIAYRTGRTLTFDSESETFPGDAEANRLVSREYRYPFVVPDQV